MITVIYCTRENFPQHTEHIKKTSGIKDIEVIEYINRGESLTKFYNKGLKESKNNIVIFCHDDIVFNTKNWGKRILKHFNTTDYGILGVAGTTHMAENGRWWQDGTKMMGQVRHTHEGKYWDSKYCSSFGDRILESIIVDGLFFGVDKKRLSNNFNEEFNGFHFYEIDFCFSNHLSGTKVGVMSDIRITHKSIGMTNQEWENNREQFANKYKDKLPYNIKNEIFYDEYKSQKLKSKPKVGVIIPTKGNVNLLTNCVNSIIEKDDYDNLEIFIADTGSTDDEKKEIKELILKHQEKIIINLIEYDYYNFAKINNEVVWNHVGEDVGVLLFCNNDIELINNAITRMIEVLVKNKNVGTVGSRLHFGDGSIQHGGVMAFLDQQRRIRISHKGLRSYYNYTISTTEVFGNTAAFMMIKKDIFNKIGGFNQGYQECFEDVELNIDCLSRNLKNYFVPNAVCYHYESQSRKNDPQKLEREHNDYVKRLIPFIITNKKCYNHFENVSAKDLEMIINESIKNLVQ
jgi:GT2 family glycosyltransferase